jgi:hypothetical protein
VQKIKIKIENLYLAPVAAGLAANVNILIVDVLIYKRTCGSIVS